MAGFFTGADSQTGIAAKLVNLMQLPPMLSIVVPIHNEEPAILRLYDRLTRVLDKLRKPYEMIFIDDASTDRSFELLANLCETDSLFEGHPAAAQFRSNGGSFGGFRRGAGQRDRLS